MGDDELARGRAGSAEARQKLAVRGKFLDAVVGVRIVSFRNENVPVGRNDDSGRTVELSGGRAGDPGLAQGHQDVPLRAEFEDLVPSRAVPVRIRDPDVSVGVDVDSVRPDEQRLAESPNPPTRRIVQMDGRQAVPADAAILAASLGDPQVVLNIRVNGTDRPQRSGVRRLNPSGNFVVENFLRASHTNRAYQYKSSGVSQHPARPPGLYRVPCKQICKPVVYLPRPERNIAPFALIRINKLNELHVSGI